VRVEALMPWAVKGGPLTIGNADGTVHLALFERQDHSGSTAIAFGARGEQFLGVAQAAGRILIGATGKTQPMARRHSSTSRLRIPCR
jgi:hypothetical protein